MKNKDYMKIMSLADDKYVEEADPEADDAKKAAVKPSRRGRIMRAVAIAASVAVCVTAGSLALFMPFDTSPPDVSKYSDSEYYPLIQKLNALNYTPPKYKNNFQKLMAVLSSLLGGLSGGKDYNDAPNAGADNESAQGYVEITDNQVDGVIEADKIKRSEEYIYYLDGAELKIYGVAGSATQLVGSYLFECDKNGVNSYFNEFEWEFFLSSDCRTVTVMGMYYNKEYGDCTFISSLDVTNPENITEKDRASVTGRYSTSRSVGGRILIVTDFTAYSYALDYSDESTFVPSVDTGDGFELIDFADIHSPEALTGMSYSVVLMFDENTLELCGEAAYMSYSSEIYIASDTMYFTSNAYRDRVEDGKEVRVATCEISLLGYGDGLNALGTVTVDGYVRDRFCLDEYEGILRVVTTTYPHLVKVTGYDIFVDAVGLSGGTSASLYCIDLSDLSVVASVENFAPEGESVQSARFEGDKAYVCTAEIITISDPVFFFDLSDIGNITYTDTGTIEGYSTSLIDMGNGLLLGLGVDETGNGFKAEVYREEDGKVVSVSQFVVPDAYISSEYKAYYIDRQNGLIGLGIVVYGQSGRVNGYMVLRLDGDTLTLVSGEELGGDNDVKRGVYIDGYFYMFGAGDYKVAELSEEPVGETSPTDAQ